jgi:outer membrane receptor protein involved in Fe transport
MIFGCNCSAGALARARRAGRVGFPVFALALAPCWPSVAVAQVPNEPTEDEPEGELAEVVVQATSASDRLRQSAEAVQVVDTRASRRSAADLGETLARTAGVTVQRAGGLGSDSRFSLNGLEGDQIRFFVDGVPLDFAGFSFGFANVPVNLVQRVEVYRGVVPARFGADALGGAVNLVSDGAGWGSRAAASYQAGSFDTQRATLDASHVFDADGLFVRANAFGDLTANDYPIDVDVVDASGRQRPATVRRFHDGYRAGGLGVEAGWLGRLSLRAFVTASDKEQQHDPLMINPYGAVTSKTRSAGAYVRHVGDLSPVARLTAIGGYAFGRVGFRDVSSCIYDWFGQCPRQRVTPGEVENVPRDNVIDNHAAYLRANVDWEVAAGHNLRFAISPDAVIRSGDERRPRTLSGVDPLEAERLLVSNVTGIEYQLEAWDERLQNVASVKSYLQLSRSERPVPTGGVERLDRDTHTAGVGDALRWRVTERLWAKASYEYATRLPRADEVFGDGALIEENLDLEPETSHNANLGLSVDSGDTRAGHLWVDGNLFYRNASDLIRRVGTAVFFTYQNVAAARTMGADATVRWGSPGQFVTLESSATFQDSRNTSTSGPYAPQRGDRIPNRPYAFGHASLELSYPDLVTAGDALIATWISRYVHSFYRTWESLGALESKPRVGSQLVHTLGLAYQTKSESRALVTSLEVQNVSDSRVYDFFGVQRQGRAVFFKTTLEL